MQLFSSLDGDYVVNLVVGNLEADVTMNYERTNVFFTCRTLLNGINADCQCAVKDAKEV